MTVTENGNVSVVTEGVTIPTSRDAMEIMGRESLYEAIEKLQREARDTAFNHSQQLHEMRMSGITRMETYKARVREEAIRVKTQQGWCLPGLNETLINLDLEEYSYAWRVEGNVYFDVTLTDDGCDRSDRAQQLVERALSYLDFSANDEISINDTRVEINEAYQIDEDGDMI
jgi:hypothetical protein